MTINPVAFIISLMPLVILVGLLAFAIWFVVAIVKYARAMQQISWERLACEFYDRGKLSDQELDAICEKFKATNHVRNIADQ